MGDWKLYRNYEYGFELKYPKDWEMIIRNTDPYNKGNDLLFFQQDKRNWFAVFPKGGFGHGMQDPKKITQDDFNGKKAKMLWYDYSFPLYTYVIENFPKNWNSENLIEIKISDNNENTVNNLKNIYDSFKFIEQK